MVSEELDNYIKSQLSQRKSQEEIKTTLLSRGWNEADINLAFLQSAVVQSTAPQLSVHTNDTNQTQAVNPKHIFDFKHLKWYEWLAMLPAFILIIQGGLVGAGIGVLGWNFSLRVIRNQTYSKILKIVFVIGITIAYYIVALLTASFVVGFINGFTEAVIKP